MFEMICIATGLATTLMLPRILLCVWLWRHRERREPRISVNEDTMDVAFD